MCGLTRRGAFTGFVPQIVPDSTKYVSLYRSFAAVFCVFVLFFCQIAKRRRPTLTLTVTVTVTVTLTPTPTQARAPTRARLRHAFWKN